MSWNLPSIVLYIVSAAPSVWSMIEPQRYDGWYNNMGNPEWGAVGDDIFYDVPPSYSDLTYLPSGSDRPNARLISNNVLAGPSGLPSYMNRTALFAFIGQMVAYEVVHTSDSACPVELMRVEVPEGDTQFSNTSRVPGSTAYMPFVRSGYNRKTGHSPNNPRKPVNKVTSWIDGSSIYGNGAVWCNCMRAFTGGQLLSINGTGSFPGLNKIRLPLENFPSPVIHGHAMKPDQMWMFGDPHVHQNPGMMAVALVWFRYHNHLADQIQAAHPTWTDDEVFEASRRKVIATQQSIMVYDWLPALLGEENPLPQYSGYKDYIKSSISVMFEAAVFRLGHSQIPPGIYVRDKTCSYRDDPIRLCNSYWHSQELISEMGLEEILMGMTSQIGEREDHVIVDDLRGNTFGPLHYSRHDLTVLTIMRGRDHGLPDYNTARESLGLPRITRWKDINPWLYDKNPTAIDNLRLTYKSLAKLDVYPAGLLESTETGPGSLFKRVIIDQFTRIRDGDRFWFENTKNRMFTTTEISEIRNITFKDVILATTNIDSADIQDEVFFWKEGDPCSQPKQMVASDLQACTPHQGYDYFTGSEVSYITSFTCLCLLPFICILVAYLIHKLKMRKQQKAHGRTKFNKTESVIHEDGDFHVQEWIGSSNWNAVRVCVDNIKFTVNVKSGRKTIRGICLGRYENIMIWVSNDHGKDLFMLHVPREYDLVVRFYDEAELLEFTDKLKVILRMKQKPLLYHTYTQNEILEKAMTKSKRGELITKFFKSIFAEAYNITDIPHPDELQLTQCKEIVECELSRQEFAEALALKEDSIFVDQMFSIVDKDGNGYISFRELLYCVLMFAQGSCEDKLNLVFAMYDKDKSGTLDKNEVIEMIKSMLEMANTQLCPDEIDQLVEKMFDSAGLDTNSSLTLDNFSTLLSGQVNMFWDVCIDFKGTKICLPKGKKKNAKKAAMTTGPPQTARQSKATLPKTLSFDDAVILNARNPSVFQMKMTVFQHFLENNRRQIVYTFLFYSICTLAFFERFYTFSVEKEHTGLRSLTGYGLSVTRGAAATMSFCFSLLLFTMCRNTITVLRETMLNYYIPFDSHVAFHKMVAYTALFFTVIHILGYCFNFYHVATQPVPYLCVIDEIFFRSDYLPNFNYWIFQTLTGMTGVLLCITICIIYIFANPIARRYIFNAFWITHQLFYLLYILTILHGASRLVQQPYFPYYLSAPVSLFVIDKLVSLSKSKKEISVVRADLLPSEVTMLEFKRPSDLDYRSGQWIRLACDKLGSREYHAFTLTSAPHEEHLSVHIRGIGPWTKNIRNLFHPETLNEEPYPKLYVDGPFGAGQQDWFRYEVSILVGAGIGITPYASILKDFVFLTSAKKTHGLKCHKVYFVWMTASQKHFEWFIDILRQVEEVDHKGIVETHIFITQLFQSFDLRTTMLYIFEEHFQRMSGRSLFTGVRAQTHFGRPNFEKIFDAVHSKHPKCRRVGVFSCGPPGMTKGVQQSCSSSSKRGKTRFEHHYENF